MYKFIIIFSLNEINNHKKKIHIGRHIFFCQYSMTLCSVVVLLSISIFSIFLMYFYYFLYYCCCCYVFAIFSIFFSSYYYQNTETCVVVTRDINLYVKTVNSMTCYGWYLSSELCMYVCVSGCMIDYRKYIPFSCNSYKYCYTCVYDAKRVVGVFILTNRTDVHKHRCRGI